MMQDQLTPVLDRRIRFAVLAGLLVPVFLAPGLSLLVRFAACVLPILFTGTFRVTRFRGASLETTFHFGFVPVLKHRCKLAAIVTIGTRYGGNTGIWTFVLFGPVQWIFCWIFDYLVPALGGPFELWVETAKGREFVVWQGASQQHFEQNLELLCNETGATVKAR